MSYKKPEKYNFDSEPIFSEMFKHSLSIQWDHVDAPVTSKVYYHKFVTSALRCPLLPKVCGIVWGILNFVKKIHFLLIRPFHIVMSGAAINLNFHGLTKRH